MCYRVRLKQHLLRRVVLVLAMYVTATTLVAIAAPIVLVDISVFAKVMVRTIVRMATIPAKLVNGVAHVPVFPVSHIRQQLVIITAPTPNAWAS